MSPEGKKAHHFWHVYPDRPIGLTVNKGQGMIIHDHCRLIPSVSLIGARWVFVSNVREDTIFWARETRMHMYSTV